MALKRTSCGVSDLTLTDGDSTLWDTRNRRRSSSEYSTSSGFSSCSSPEGHTGVKHDTCSLLEHVQKRTMSEVNTASLQTTHSQKHVVQHMHTQSGPAPRETSMAPWASAPVSRGKMKVFVRVQGESDETCLRQIYKPVLDMIDPNTDVIDFIDDVAMDGGKWPLVLFGGCTDMKERAQTGELMMPSLGLVLLLQEQEIVGSDRLENITGYFQKPPWKFHHSEWVAAHRIKAYPYNSLDYFFVADELPVCSVRQVHGSKEHMRVLRYITHDNWTDSFNLYKLIINKEPDYNKSDFCVFTIETHKRYTIQFAMKRLPKGIMLAVPCHTVLSFQVPDPGGLVSLLPHKHKKLSDIRWKTTDLDGNDILLELCTARRKHRQRPKSRAKSCSSRQSNSSTSSFASVLLDTAEEFIAADDTRPDSVFSEPYVYNTRKEFGFDESSSSSTTHSVIGIEATRFSFGESPSSRSLKAINRALVDDVGIPENKRYAWVREMMEAESKLRASCQNQSCELEHQTGNCVHQHGSHQHTDSGFADDRSDEGERHRHQTSVERCTKVQRGNHVSLKHCNGRVEDTSSQFNHNNTWHGKPLASTHCRNNPHRSRHKQEQNVEAADPCDEEIERMRLFHSHPNLTQIPTTPRTQSGPNLSHNAMIMTDYVPGGRNRSQQDSLRRRRTSYILPNRAEIPSRSDQSHLSAYQQNILNIRARGQNEFFRQPMNKGSSMSQEFGAIPPRCTSTPLIQYNMDSPGFQPTKAPGESTVEDEHNEQECDSMLSQSQSSSCDKQLAVQRYDKSKLSKTNPVNGIRRLFPDLGISDDSPKGKNQSAHARSPSVKQSAFAVVHPQQKEVQLRNGYVGINERVVTAEVHHGGTKQAESESESGSYSDIKSKRCTEKLDAEAFLASRDNISNSIEHIFEQSATEAEESFEEAAIDCPVSFVKPTKSRTASNLPSKTSTCITQSKLTDNGPSKTMEIQKQYAAGRATPQPEARLDYPKLQAKCASKMVTFAEEVQEKDISICMDDDVFETSRDSEPKSTEKTNDIPKLGFWI